VAKVCVVGAGISGVACARALTAGGIEVEIRERAAGPGGRMASPRMTWSDLGERVVDSGAAYFTVRDDEFRGVVEGWLTRGLTREWTDTFHLLPTDDGTPGVGAAKVGPMRYAAPGGLRFLVADLADGLVLRPRTPVGQVAVVSGRPTVDGEAFDVVVLAMPDPQARRLLAGDLPEEQALLAGREWEPVLALLAAFPRRTWDDFDGGFVQDDEVLAFVADDGSRRGDGAPVIVAHSTGPWAAGRLDQPPDALGPLSEALDRILGCGLRSQALVHRWTFARPAEAREQAFGYTDRRIGFAGDGWGSPKVETAWRSGTLLGRRIAADVAPG
jgi:renalase